MFDEDVNFGSDLPHLLEQIKQMDKDAAELRRRGTEKREQQKQELENDRRCEKEEAEIGKERLNALRRAAVLRQEQLEGKMKVLQKRLKASGITDAEQRELTKQREETRRLLLEEPF